MLSMTPEAAVDATSDVRLWTMWMNSRVMPPTIPPADMHPPKHMAHTISHIVPIIPAMPRVPTSPARVASSVAS